MTKKKIAVVLSYRHIISNSPARNEDLIHLEYVLQPK